MRWMIAPLSLLLAASWGGEAAAGATGAPGSSGGLGPLSAANGRFAIDLYREMGGGVAGNIFLSPYSISSALAMTWAGARGQTQEEMGRLLRFAAPPESIHAAMRELRSSLEGVAQKGDIELSVANRLWGDRAYTFLPAYLETTREAYAAALEPLDFVGAADASRGIINRWVEKETKDRIRDLLPPGSIDASTRLVLTNAIYFKGKWAKPFAKDATHDEPFHAIPAAEASVPMMHESLKADLATTDGGRLLLLPYEGNALSMAILLPDEADGLADMEKGLTWEKLDSWIGSAAPRQVILSLPRFRTTSMFTLSESLAKMGMPSAFDPAKADFSGIDGKRDLCISLVVHKAFVEVAEEGTEAAAATGVVVGITSIAPVEKPVSFVVDHPFLFLIRDNASGAILFMGRITNPLS